MAKPIIFDILAIDDASRTFTKVGMAAQGMGTKVESAGKVASRGFMVAGLAAGALAIHAVKMAGDFDAAIVRLETTAGESHNALKMVGNGLLDMAGKVGYSAEALARGMYIVESAGYHGAAGLKVMEAAAKGARVEGADLGATANAVSSLLVDYHLSADQAARVTNVLTAAVGHGKTTFQEMATALPNVAAAGAAAKISMEEVASAIATMTMHGTDAAKAGTYLRQVIGQLEAPSAKASSVMESLGINVNNLGQTLSSGSGHGLADAIKMVDDAITKHLTPSGLVALDTFTKSKKPLSDYKKVLADLPGEYVTSFGALSKMVGGVKSLQGFLQLGGKNLETYKGNVKAVRDQVKAGGNDVEGFAQQQKTLNGKLNDASGAASAFSVKLGHDLMPAAQATMSVVISFIGVLSAHDKAVSVAVVGLTAIAVVLGTVKAATAAAALATSLLGGAEVVLALQMGVVALATGDFAGALAGLELAIAANPIGMIAVGVAAAATALFGLHKILGKTSQATHDNIKPTVDFAASLDQVTGAATRQTRALAYADLQKRGAIATGNMLGLSARDLVGASLGLEGAIKRVNAAISIYDKKYKSSTFTTDAFGNVVQATTTGADDLAVMLGLTADKFKKQSTATRLAALAVATWREALKGVPKKVQTLLALDKYKETATQIDAIGKKYGLTPKQIKTIFTALNVSPTLASINQLNTAANQAARPRKITFTYGTIGNVPNPKPGKGLGVYPVPHGNRGGSSNRTGPSHGREIGHLLGDTAQRLVPGFHDTARSLSAVFMDNLAAGVLNGRTKFATAIEKVKAIVSKETDKLQKLLADRTSIVQGFMGMTSSVFGQDLSGAPGGTSVSGLIAFQQQQLTNALQVQADVAKLVSEGLSKALVTQLANSGATGAANLHALAQGPQSAIATLNAMNAQTSAALSAAGMTAGNSVYGSQIQAAQSDVKTAQAVVRELEKWRKQHDKNTIVELHIGPNVIRASLLELKRKNGKPLGLS